MTDVHGLHRFYAASRDYKALADPSVDDTLHLYAEIRDSMAEMAASRAGRTEEPSVTIARLAAETSQLASELLAVTPPGSPELSQAIGANLRRVTRLAARAPGVTDEMVDSAQAAIDAWYEAAKAELDAEDGSES